MTTVSSIGYTTTSFAPKPKMPPTSQEKAQKELEQAVIIAKEKPDNQRTYEDYLALTIDAFQKLTTPPVVYARENAQINYLA